MKGEDVVIDHQADVDREAKKVKAFDLGRFFALAARGDGHVAELVAEEESLGRGRLAVFELERVDLGKLSHDGQMFEEMVRKDVWRCEAGRLGYLENGDCRVSR